MTPCKVRNPLFGAVLLSAFLAGSAQAMNVGDPVPTFTLFDLNGTTHTPRRYRDKVLVLYFMGYN